MTVALTGKETRELFDAKEAEQDKYIRR